MPLGLFNRLRRARNLARTFREALSLHQRGQLSEAERLYRAVLDLAPGHVQSLYNLGLIHLTRGEFDDALRLIGEALDQKPNFAEARNVAGMALRALKRHQEALAYFETALGTKPDFAEAENNFGASLQALNRFEEAVAHYRNAIAIKPDYAAAHCSLGAALGMLRRYDEALAHFERALALEADFAQAYNGRGITLRTLGRLEEARHDLEKAVELAPRKAEFYGSLAESKRFAAGDRHLAMIEGLAHDMASLPEEEQVRLHFALGKVYADLGQRDLSFSHFVKGNALKRKQIVYDEPAAMAQFERTRAFFTAEAIGKGRGLGNPCLVPVFIIGMPRSGTTLVEQILASHPKVYGAGELTDFETAVASLRGLNGARPGLGRDELRRISALYLDRIRANAPTAERITDKMPANFRYAGLIHLALPNARIIHTARDPVDTCLSCFSTLFGGDLPYAYDLAELGHYYRAYASLMEHWRHVLPQSVMLEVHYEEVVADFERQARRIVAHCGLEWDDACLDFHQTQRPVWTASAVQVRQPIYRSSVGRWRPNPEMLHPLLEALQS